MSNLSALLQLIPTLSKSERRSFSQYAALQKRDKAYYNLYEIIRKGKSQNIEQDFKSQNPDSDYNATVSYLWERLVKTLLTFQGGQAEEEIILSGILEIKLLFRKGLVEEAFRLIVRFKEIAKKSEKSDYLLLLEKLELERFSRYQFDGIMDEGHLVKLQSQLRFNIRYELNLADHSALYELLYFRYLQNGNILSDKDKERLNDLVVSEMNLAGNQRFESFDLNRNHLLFQSVYFMMTGDHRSSLRTFFELDQLFERNSHLWKDSPLVYVNHLRGILNNLFDSNLVNEMDYFIEKLRNLLKSNSPIIINQAICVAELKKFILLRKYESGMFAIEQEFIPLFLHTDSLAGTDKAELYLFSGLICFHSKQYKKAAGFLRKIIYLEPTKNNWLWKMIKWLNLLVNIELNEFDYLLNESGSVERLLKKQGVFYPTDKILMHYVKKIPGCMTRKAKLLLTKECLNEMELQEKNLYELQFIKTMGIQVWLAQKFVN
ncbi:MAG: hypothetical protein WCP85_15975 [Mariniphaga sp.]